MTWGTIRDRIVQRLGEYQAGAAEAEAGATFTDATIYSRMSDEFREMLNESFSYRPSRVGARVSMTYTANSESVALAAGVQYRPVSMVDRLLSSGEYEPLNILSEYQDQAARRWDSEGPVVASSAGYRVENDSIWVIPRPTETLTLRLLYLPAYAEVTSASAALSPSFIPVEHHNYLALRVAMTFLSEAQKNATLRVELAERASKFQRWAIEEPKTGPRFVHEID